MAAKGPEDARGELRTFDGVIPATAADTAEMADLIKGWKTDSELYKQSAEYQAEAARKELVRQQLASTKQERTKQAGMAKAAVEAAQAALGDAVRSDPAARLVELKALLVVPTTGRSKKSPLEAMNMAAIVRQLCDEYEYVERGKSTGPKRVAAKKEELVAQLRREIEAEIAKLEANWTRDLVNHMSAYKSG